MDVSSRDHVEQNTWMARVGSSDDIGGEGADSCDCGIISLVGNEG